MASQTNSRRSFWIGYLKTKSTREVGNESLMSCRTPYAAKISKRKMKLNIKIMKPLKNNPLFYKHKIVKFHTFEGEKLFEVVWYTDFGTMKQEMNFKPRR